MSNAVNNNPPGYLTDLGRSLGEELGRASLPLIGGLTTRVVANIARPVLGLIAANAAGAAAGSYLIARVRPIIVQQAGNAGAALVTALYQRAFAP
ncbi:MAG: hypothetical protein H0X51_08580 [Parachlamydiaceae bacterium]|nr:hypothetical protein [Parachlamydiaceae bacterium]